MIRPRLPILLLGAALALASLPALALKPFNATYQASYMGVQASAQMTLAEAGNDRWRYSLVIRNPLANLNQTTVFAENGGRWRPLSGNDRSQMLVRKREMNSVFDWSARTATWSGDVKDDRRGPIALQDGDVDGMLLNLVLARDAASGRPLTYRVLENGKAKSMSYRSAGQEQVTVGGRRYTATRLVQSGDDDTLTVWVAPELPVPLRILQSKPSGDTLELRLTAISD